MREINLEEIKKSLKEMNIPYMEDTAPENQAELVKTFGYAALPLRVDLSNVKDIDAELGVVVHNADLTVDDGIYIFTVLKSGQAGFIVVEPGTISRAPMVRKVTGDIINVINGIDLPPLTPFDMVEITAHMLANTFIRRMMDSVKIPEEQEQAFLRLYMPKFLANVGLYFVGATKEDGSPMIYEEVVNMEPMMILRSIQKGAALDNESGDAGKAGEVEERIKTETKES